MTEDLPPVTPGTLLKRRIEEKQLAALTNLDLNSLHALFDGAQQTGDTSPSLNKAKFIQFLIECGNSQLRDPAVANSFFDALDVNHNGHVDKRELLFGLLALSEATLESKLKFCFRVYDLNKDHVLERHELRHLLTLMTAARSSITPPDIDAIVEAIYRDFDVNHDNVISESEFIAAAMARPDLCEMFTWSTLKFKRH
ncbi:hypothetical protein Pelo_8332 [Pelomyxa schiedti]|nr:hypothetical protein Pelo_8332 [Pelomyxa schiedti]